MEAENSTTSPVPAKKKRGRKAGRPKGSGTKTVKKKRGKRRGRPKGSMNIEQRIATRGRRRGRPSQGANPNHQLSNGIHLIGELLVVDINLLGCTEVVFIGKAPKIR